MGIVSYQGLIYIVGGCTHSRRHMQVRVLTYSFLLYSYGARTIGPWLTHPWSVFSWDLHHIGGYVSSLKHCTKVHFLSVGTEHPKQMGEWTQSPCEKMVQGCCDTMMIHLRNKVTRTKCPTGIYQSETGRHGIIWWSNLIEVDNCTWLRNYKLWFRPKNRFGFHNRCWVLTASANFNVTW